jgi:ABC-2 type transport system permease protein
MNRRGPATPAALFRREIRVGTVVVAVATALLVRLSIAAFEAAGASTIMKAAKGLENSPAIRSLQGYAFGVSTAGGYTVWKEGQYLALLGAAYFVLAATRLVRAGEDNGSFDLLVLSRWSRGRLVLDQLATLVGAGLLVGVVGVAGFASHGWSAGSAALFCLGIALVGAFAGAVGLVAAQCLAPRRSATIAGLGSVIALFLLRMMADGTGLTTLDWFTPFGWIERLRPYGRHDLWPLAPLAAVTLGLLVVAVALSRRRDIGSGVVQRNDRAAARTSLLSSPVGFAWRQRYSILVAWLAAGGLISGLLAGLTHAVTSFIQGNPAYRKLLARLGESEIVSGPGFLAYIDLFLALALMLLIANLLHAEVTDETTGRLDVPFATGPSRAWWSGSVVLASLAGVIVVTFVCGLGGFVGAAAVHGHIGLGAALAGAYNAMVVVIPTGGVALLLIGLVPRWANLAVTALVVAAFAVDFFGSLLHWPRGIIDLSPFHQLGQVPQSPPNWTAMVVMAVVGIVAGSVGVGLFSRRDLVTA